MVKVVVNGVQNSIHKTPTLIGGKKFGDLNSLIDGDLWRHVGEIQKFGASNAENDLVHQGDAVELPAFNFAANGLVNQFPVAKHVTQQSYRECRWQPSVIDERVLQDFLGALFPQLNGIRSPEGSFPGLSPGWLPGRERLNGFIGRCGRQ